MSWANTFRERRGAGDRRDGGRRTEELNAALASGQVEILFQPQFAGTNGALVGAEALSRWHHPQLGRIGIEALCDIAARAGRSADLTRHIASRALAAAAGWPPTLRLSLNVTAADLADQAFAATILAVVAEAGFTPERLTLEITEQALVTDIDRTVRQLEQLASHDIHIALDDFGAGFCNFHYLKHLPLHELKLDRRMVQDIAHDERDLAVLHAIVTITHVLGLSVVAEGVETEEQRAAIAREGCEKWQGFLGGAPMTAEEFALIALR